MIIYYAEDRDDLLPRPQPVLSLLTEDDAQINRCPAFADYYRNVFAISPTFDYSLDYDKEQGTLVSDEYTQEYFDNYVVPRDLPNGVFSYLDPKLYVVPDVDSLVVELMGLTYPFDSTEYSVVPGAFDVGRYVRPIELAMQVSKSTKIKFKRGKPVYLLRFRTNEKIVFKRFSKTEAFTSITKAIHRVRDGSKKNRPLSYYYKLSAEYKLKKQMLRLAKQNVID